jgi:dinuclear metal center YbgI/SA1388 family protein
MIIGELIKYLEDWAPPGAAWNNDNVGLQIGSKDKKVEGIFVCLELSEKPLDDAINKNCNFIFTHHPLIFNPLKRIDLKKDKKAALIEKIIKNDITVYSAHTNLDFTKDGISFELANTLKLKNVRFLVNEESNQYKIVVFVPNESLEKVSNAIFNVSGGIIGEYEKCSFRLNGSGTFEGSKQSKPSIGKKQTFETVDEVRLEVLVDSWKLRSVLCAINDNHPYDEPAYDVYPLKNKNVNYGYGVIGELEQRMSVKSFLKHVCASLKTNTLKYCKSKKNSIKKVAVCGGSGSQLLSSAIDLDADAFVTGDIKYHSFQDAENKILYVDAGHYETEIHSLKVVKSKIENFLAAKKEKVDVSLYKSSTNPVRIYNNKGVQ